jgi:putative CocE/NonD family hydrolase
VLRRRLLPSLALILAVGLLPLARPADAAPAASSATKACGTAFPRYAPRATASGSTLMGDVPIVMSDGVVLKADVTLPTGVTAAKGRYPVALTVTGYGKTSIIGAIGGASGLVSHGYATVVVDDRGTGASGGVWDSWGERTRDDYGELIDWITHQRWSDGRIGVTGASYMGISSLFVAATGKPAVKGVFAVVPMADAYRDIVLAGGELNTAFIPLWVGLVTGLALQPNAPGEAIADHLHGLAQFQVPTIASAALGGDVAYDGSFWRQRSPIEAVSKISAPTFVVGGLDDLFQRGEPLLYEALSKHTQSRLLLGPWSHVGGATGAGLPRDGVPDLGSLTLQWFDQHVKGLDAKADCIPQVTQYVRGHERNESTTTWPVPGLSAQRWNLRGDGTLTRSAPGRVEAARSYLSLPVNGLCSRSTAQWLIGLLDTTPCATDNRLDEVTALTYTSAPFTKDTVINGPIEADLWITTQSNEAVVSVAVSDVAPDGTSRGLTNGLLLATQRKVDPSRSRLLDGQSIQPWHPFTVGSKQRVDIGRPMKLPIEVFPTSAALAPGHRLRITVAPYDVPHALPPAGSALDSLLGTVTILNDATHPSSVVLPIVTKR